MPANATRYLRKTHSPLHDRSNLRNAKFAFRHSGFAVAPGGPAIPDRVPALDWPADLFVDVNVSAVGI